MKKVTPRFTLVELLVVLAIIGILVSILLPSLAKARAEAKLTLCISNESQIGKGTYTNENNGKYPDSNSTASFDVRVHQMTNEGQPSKLFICPEDTEERPDGNWINSYNPNGDRIWQAGTKEGHDWGFVGRSRYVSEVSSDTNHTKSRIAALAADGSVKVLNYLSIYTDRWTAMRAVK